MKKTLLLFVSLCFLSIFSLSVSPSYAAGTIEKAEERGVLRVGFSSFVPWAMQNKAGEFVGFEIDVATRLAEDLGLRLQLAPTAWAGIIPALLAGKFDLIIGGMGITDERLEQVDFSDPYDFTRLELLANVEKAANFKSREDYNKPEVVIAIRTGTTPALLAEKVFPNATLRQFAEEALCVEEVLAGRAHAFLTSAPLPSFAAADNPDKVFVAFELEEYKEPIGMALRKNDPESLRIINEWVAARTADGWLKERADYWFKSKDWEKNL